MNEKLSDVSAAEKELADLLKRVDPDGSRPFGADEEIERLRKVIADGHDYVFIGKVGQFCPIKDGCGGGLLCRESVDKKTGEKKYDAATGTKGYRWSTLLLMIFPNLAIWSGLCLMTRMSKMTRLPGMVRTNPTVTTPRRLI